MALLFNFSGTCIWNIVKMSYCEHTKLSSVIAIKGLMFCFLQLSKSSLKNLEKPNIQYIKYQIELTRIEMRIDENKVCFI